MIIGGFDESVKFLNKGELIGYPTEAVYGLGCDPWNKESVNKISKLKGRSPDKPFLMVISSKDQLEDLVDVSSLTDKVWKSWPGHTTWLIKAKDSVPSWMKDKQTGKVGIRMSEHPVVVDLCNLFKKPLISTSANISGKSEIKDPLLFKKTFMTEIKYLVDGRLGNYEKTSIIVDMESEQKIR